MNKELMQDALRVVRETRELSLPGFGKAVAEKWKDGDPGSVVTRSDYEVEEFLSKRLGALDSGIVFVGEEYGGDRGSARFWLCDPIDGTGNYVRGVKVVSTMLTYIEDGAPAFSAIYDFVNDDMYYAVAGGGAFRNDEPIHVNERGLSDAYLFYESNLNLPGNVELWRAVRQKAPMPMTMSAGYEYAMVASGKGEGRINKDPYGKDYDFAPGALLVAEAGGVVRNLGSDSYDYKNLDFIAATPACYRDLTEGPDALFPLR